MKTAHTDRAREAVSKTTIDWLQANLIQPSFTQGDDPKSNGLAERLVGWVKARARLHLAAAGLGFEHWPTAMALACAEHRHRTLQLPGRVHQYGQRVIFKSKHPTGESKKPFLRWEYATYLAPCTQTDQGHVLIRESTGGYLIARNIRPTSELVDPERELRDELPMEAEVEPSSQGGGSGPERRVTGKRSVKAITTASEALAQELLAKEDFSSEACSRILQLAFGGSVSNSKRVHRGSINFSIVLGAYGHGGLRGITKATQSHPQLCLYLNHFLQRGVLSLTPAPQWSAVTIVQADEVEMHRDVRNEPGTPNFLSSVSSRQLWLSQKATGGVKGADKIRENVIIADQKGIEETGDEYQVGGRVVSFDARQPHAMNPAVNWVIAGYSPLGTRKLPKAEIERLKELGFNPPGAAQVGAAKVCKLVGPNPQRMPMPTARRRTHQPIQTRHLNVRFARIPPEEWRMLCELDEAQFELGMERWTQVLRGADEDEIGGLSAVIPRGLLVGTLRDGRQWLDNPILEYRLPNGTVVPVARVLQFTDDDSMYLDDSPFPDRLMMFDIIDLERNVNEVIVIRVLVEEVRQAPVQEMERVLHVPGPEQPEIMALQTYGPVSSEGGFQAPASGCPRQLPVPLPNPTALESRNPGWEEELGARAKGKVYKAEVATTNNLESLLEELTEPLSVTHTAPQAEVRPHLQRWHPAIKKELDTLKGPGVLVSHFGEEAKSLLSDPSTTTIPLKGVFTAKPPASDATGFFRRKCRLVACGNQAPHNDAESLYASGAPSELVRAALVEASLHQWGAYTCDIRSAFTLTPIPKEAGRRYVLRPPKWLVELGLAEEGECYTLGRVLYGFREAPVWWAEFRDEVLRGARFEGCQLVQGKADPSIWKIQREGSVLGFLITYVDDFLILSDATTAQALHRWILEEAKWETDGLAEARPGAPVRFLGMQLERGKDGSYTLDQEAYVDELIRAHALTPAMRSKVTCPREIMYGPEETEDRGDETPKDDGELVLKQAQRLAGECLWLAQRTRIDIAFTTSILCSLVSVDPYRAVAIGNRLLMYLAQTKSYKLKMRADPTAPALRIFTDASYAPEGRHSYGGHILEFRGSPVVWRAGRQQLVAMSSAEAELIQVIEGCTYGESLIALLGDLSVECDHAQVEVDNTAAISLARGGCSQRTRHLKVRGAKLNQLLQQGWLLGHCQGLYQKADILTKPLPSARLRFLCDLIGLGPTEDNDASEPPRVQTVKGAGKVVRVCLVSLLTSLQGVVCKGQQEKPAIEVDWPWELMLAMLLIILSTVCLWETVKSGCQGRQDGRGPEVPKIRAVSTAKERKAKRLQDRVSAAIESAVSETSPSGSDATVHKRRGRNKCPQGQPTPEAIVPSPTIQAGVVHLHSPRDPLMNADLAYQAVFGGMPAASSAAAPQLPVGNVMPTQATAPVHHASSSSIPYPAAQVQTEVRVPGPSQVRVTSQITQTEPVVILTPDSSVYTSAGGHCIHCEIGCKGLRNAGHIHTRSVCQYCLRKAGPRSGF